MDTRRKKKKTEEKEKCFSWIPDLQPTNIYLNKYKKKEEKILSRIPDLWPLNLQLIKTKRKKKANAPAESLTYGSSVSILSQNQFDRFLTMTIKGKDHALALSRSFPHRH